ARIESPLPLNLNGIFFVRSRPFENLTYMVLHGIMLAVQESSQGVSTVAPQLHPLEVSCAEVKEKLDAGQDLLMLDCREPQEYDVVHLPHALLIPMSEIPHRLSELPASKDEEMIVYCHHGGRSLQVAWWLSQQGYAKVKSLSGGIDQWAL